MLNFKGWSLPQKFKLKGKIETTKKSFEKNQVHLKETPNQYMEVYYKIFTSALFMKYVDSKYSVYKK